MTKPNKFSFDSLYNLVSVGLGGVLYILINTFIIHGFSEKTLGVFNQAYAIYIIISQITAFGIHLSIQQFIPRFYKQQDKINETMSAAIILTFIISVIVVAITFPFTFFVGQLFNSDGVQFALQICLGGIILFSLNKVILAFFNGKRFMKSFAIFTFLRFLLMFISSVIIIYYYQNEKLIALILVVPEAILFIILLITLLSHIKLQFNTNTKHYLIEHFNFGKQAFIGNLLLDVNTRVDVVMLGIFLNDSMVGIYSFVLAVAEGILQIPVVFRNNINPIITKASVMDNVSNKLSVILKQNIKTFYKYIGGIALITIVLYPVGLLILSIDNNFWTYYILYSILALGIILSSGYLPLNMIFNQLKQPKIQSKFFFLIFIINVLANAIFINLIGLYGAAIGTALSYIAHIILIKHYAKKHCNLSL
tara:strand:+ start:1380 stop:2645 length:1266 start_codon:yes stop_codon:yes gene_type:complete